MAALLPTSGHTALWGQPSCRRTSGPQQTCRAASRGCCRTGSNGSGGSSGRPAAVTRRQRSTAGCRSIVATASSRQGSSTADDLPNSREGGTADRGGQREQPRRRRRRERGGSGQKREDLAFFIARSDLTWEQPWRFEQSAALPELRLRSQGVAALDDAAAEAPGRDHAVAAFTVQLPAGMGALVVTGTVQASIPLRCEFCSEPYETAVEKVPFDGVIFAGSAPGGEAELGANELIFDLDDALCDITPLVTDAIVSCLPTVCLCGGGSCRQHAGKEVVWTTSPATPPAAASPFAKLLQGKQKQKRK